MSRGMNPLRAAFVIGRRDYGATVLSKTFLFFLVGPLFPILLGVSAGIFEYSSFVRQSRQLTDTANSIAEILAADADTTVSSTDLHYAVDSTMLTFPKVLSDSTRKGIAWANDITISLAGISFAPTVSGCTSSCTYKAAINWTGGGKQRACGSLQSSATDSLRP